MPSATEQIIHRATQADNLIAQIRKEIAEVRSSVVASWRQQEEERLTTENDALKREVEHWKKKLIELEICHGIKQVTIPQQQINAPVSTGVLNSVELENGPDQMQQIEAENLEKLTPSKNDKKNTKENKTKVKEPPRAAVPEMIDVSRLDLRVGRIVEVNKHPDADALYVEQIDVGESKPRTIISGLVKHVTQEELQNRLVIVLCNLKPVKMRGIASEGMVMCASTPEKVEVLSPPVGSAPGQLVHCEGYQGKADAQLNPKKKVFETVAPDLKTNEELLATYKGKALTIVGLGPIKTATLVNAFIK